MIEIKRVNINYLAEKVEKPFYYLSMFLYSGALLPLLRRYQRGEVTASEGDPIFQLVWFTLYLFSIIYFTIHIYKFYRCRKDWWVILLLVYAIVSILWAIDPSVTLRRGFALIGTSLFGILISIRLKYREFIRMILNVLIVIAVLSILFSLLVPHLGRMEELDNAWRGVMIHKNIFGRTMVLGSIIIFLIKDVNYSKRIFYFGLFSFLVLMSNSKGAWILFVIIYSLFLISYISSKIPKKLFRNLIFSIFIITSILFSIIYFENILFIIGKDATLTGRTILWVDVINMIYNKPLIGYGYDSFWLGWNGPSSKIWDIHLWLPPHSHNGFLDLLLDLGVVGFIIYVIGFIKAYQKANLMTGKRITEQYFPLVFLVFTLIINLFESQILQSNNIYWICYIALLFYLKKFKF